VENALRVRDMAALRGALGRGRIEAAEPTDRLIVGPVHGAILAFEPAAPRR
jgi:hypothetical protein